MVQVCIQCVFVSVLWVREESLMHPSADVREFEELELKLTILGATPGRAWLRGLAVPNKKQDTANQPG